MDDSNVFNVFFALSISKMWVIIRVNAACAKQRMKWISSREAFWKKEKAHYLIRRTKREETEVEC